MIDFTKPHNWIGLAIAVLLVGFLIHQVGQKVPAVGRVSQASGL